MYRSGTALLLKLRHCFISITAKNKIGLQKTTLRNSCYYDNYKTRLSMTKCLALQSKYQKKKYEAILVSKRVLTFPNRGYVPKF